MHPFVQVDLLGVDMAVEVDDAYFLVAEVAADPTHGGKADRVVSAENDREGAAGEHVGDAFGDLVEALLVVGGNGEDVADVAEGDLFTQVHPHFVVVRGVEG